MRVILIVLLATSLIKEFVFNNAWLDVNNKKFSNTQNIKVKRKNTLNRLLDMFLKI